MNTSMIWSLLKESYTEWRDDKATRLAAALSYYTAIAAAPLVTGVLAIAGFVFSTEQAQAQLVAQVRNFVGAQGAEMVETILANASQPELARLAGIFSLLTLLWSASNIFTQLQDALNTIWGVKLRSDLGMVRTMLHRLLPFGIVIGIGILLLALIVANTALSALNDLISDLLPGGAIVWQIANFFISVGVITLLFALVFKVLPDVKVAWRDLWLGAALTAILFMVGNIALSWYLGRQSGSSVYGAAGSLIVLLLWIYYSAQIFFFGAEFTQVYATHYGQGIRPARNADWAYDEDAQQAARKAAAQGRHNLDGQTGETDTDPSRTGPARVVQPRRSTVRKLVPLAMGWLLLKRLRRGHQPVDGQNEPAERARDQVNS